MKKLLWILVGVALVGWILYSNIQQQKEQSNGKRNVYVLIPLSGPIAQSGNDYRKALEYSYKTLKNPHINLIYLDDEFNASKAITTLQQATINDNYPIIISWGAIISFATIPQIKNGFIMAGGTVELEDLKKYKNYQRFSVASNETTKLATEYLASKGEKIGLIYSYDMYGTSGEKTFQRIMQEKKIPFVEMDYDPNLLSVREIVGKFLLKNKDIKTIFISATATNSFLNLIKELKEQGFTGEIVSDMSFAQKFVLDSLGKYAENIIFVTLEPHLDNPRTREAKIYRDFALNNGMYPSFSSIEGYDMVKIIDKMVQDNIPFTQETFMNMKKFDGVSGQVLFPSIGNSAYPFILAQVKDGKVVPVESETK